MLPQPVLYRGQKGKSARVAERRRRVGGEQLKGAKVNQKKRAKKVQQRKSFWAKVAKTPSPGKQNKTQKKRTKPQMMVAGMGYLGNNGN